MEGLTSSSLMYWSAICTGGGFVLLIIGAVVSSKGEGKTEDLGILLLAIAAFWTGISFFVLVISLIWHILLSIIGAF